MEDLLLSLLKRFLTKDVMKKILAPILDDLFIYLAKLAKEQTPDVTIDDIAVAAIAAAAKRVLSEW